MSRPVDRVVLAGIPAVIFSTFNERGGPSRPVCLGDMFASEAELFAFLRRVEANPQFGPAAVYPVSVVMVEILGKGITLKSIYVGTRSGRFYFSDRNAMFAKHDNYSGKNHLAIFGNGKFNSEELAKFQAALPDDAIVEVTASDSLEGRRTIAKTLNGMRIKNLEFVPVPPEREGYRTWATIAAANNVHDLGFGTLKPNAPLYAWPLNRKESKSDADADPDSVERSVSPEGENWNPGQDIALPKTFVGVFIGRTTTHVCRWSPEHLPTIMANQTLAPRYAAIKTPSPPSVMPRTAYSVSEEADTAVCVEARNLAAAIWMALPTE